MLRRFFSLLVLVAIVAGAVYLWKTRSGGAPTLGASARQLGSEARSLGAQAREKLGAVGQELHDAKVKASVKTALELDRRLQPYSIEVGSDDGVVTLRGRVADEGLRGRAETVAAGVPDVSRVVNQIQVTPGTAPAALPAGRSLGESVDDHALEMQVKLALSLRRELKGTDLSVKAYRREVTLSGEVASQAQRELALETTRDTGSVDAVVDRIQARGAPGAGPAAGEPSSGANAERVAAAQRALKSNANLSGFDLQVRDEAGRLVLRGHVRTLAEKDLAGMIAREGAGASVENAVEIRPGGS